MRAAALIVFLASAAIAAPVPKVAPKTPSLDGKWITTERSHSGGEIKARWVWVIEGETFTAHSEKDGGVGTPSFPGATTTLTRPDPAKPDEYDYTYQDGSTKLVYRGRLAWDGEEWLFCMGEANGDRPAEVKAGQGVYFHRFKRIADK